MHNGGVTIAYSGVHEAYQLALAAEEAGSLDCFYCSVFASPGKWGGRLSRLASPDALMSRRVAGIPIEKVTEFPWPLLWHHAVARIRPRRPNGWVGTNGRFDEWVAKRLCRSTSRVFVGVETCAEKSLAAAKELGMRTVLECPGIDTEFLDTMALKAASEFGIRTCANGDGKPMKHRKRAEVELADLVLLCSDFQARKLGDRKVANRKVAVAPIWVNTVTWRPSVQRRDLHRDRLKVLFAGKI